MATSIVTGSPTGTPIIDGLVKPTFDGVLPLPDLAGAIAEARAAIMPDPRQAALKRKIAEIRARPCPVRRHVPRGRREPSGCRAPDRIVNI